jgi:hypothetical protein
LSVGILALALRTAFAGFRRWLADASRYGELDADHRHLFWKRVQVAAFLAVMPLFVALGALSRALKRGT